MVNKSVRKGKVRKKTPMKKRSARKNLAQKRRASQKAKMSVKTTAKKTVVEQTVPEQKDNLNLFWQIVTYLKRHFTHLPKWKYITREAPRLFSWLTVGMPFVGYKFFAAVILWRMYAEPWPRFAATLLFVLGTVDLFIHVVNFYAMCCCGHRFFPVCLLALLNKKMYCFKQKQEIGEAVDSVLSFAIVACVVGKGLYVHLDSWQSQLWNMCTVVNVLGAGLSQLQAAIYAERMQQQTEIRK